MKNDKLIGDDLTIVNQILPHTNKWAFDLYLRGCANNWMPTEISMQKDVEQWKGKLSDDEKLVIKRCLGFFAGSESLVSNNLLLTIFRYVCDAECRQYISRQQFEESLHNLTIVYICDSLNLDIQELYAAYDTIPSIKKKDDFLVKITKDIHKPDFNINSVKGKRELLRNLITYYILCEGMFFYAGFAAILSFSRKGLIPGICEQITYSLRDEANHLEFGITLINKIKEQEPELWTDSFKEETLEYIRKTTELETEFAQDILPNGLLGLTEEMFLKYMKYLANRRCEQIGLNKLFRKVQNPFPWLSEVIELPKLKNFFETKVTEYQSGGMIDDF